MRKKDRDAFRKTMSKEIKPNFHFGNERERPKLYFYEKLNECEMTLVGCQ